MLSFEAWCKGSLCDNSCGTFSTAKNQLDVRLFADMNSGQALFTYKKKALKTQRFQGFNVGAGNRT